LYIQGARFLYDRNGKLTPIQNEEISDKDGRMRQEKKEIIIYHVIKHSGFL